MARCDTLALTSGEVSKATLLSRCKPCPDSPSGIVNLDGTPRGSKRKDGYWILRCKGKNFLAHRIVYELTHGPIPDGLVIDHKDRNPSNNNPLNLRAVPQAVNLENVDVRPHCQSGHKFINKDKRTGRFSVRIKRVNHGTFSTIEEAVVKRDAVLNYCSL